MNKVLISVAPVCGAPHDIVPEEIAKDVIKCWEAGAAMVHLHVRDSHGGLTTDTTLFQKTIDLIRAKTNMIIEASTGGVSNLNIKERCVPLYLDDVEACSLNVGSTNLGKQVYCNPLDDVDYCIRQILAQHKTPEVETFELGHTYTMMKFMQKYPAINPVLFSIVVGHEGEAPATPQSLAAMIQMIPESARWGITQANRKDFSFLAAAVGMGAETIRIGFEDSNYLNPTTQVDTNLPLVEKTVQLLKAMDKEPMTPDEGREYFKIGQ